MTERPILFSAPMVSALLAGTKTQTRRIVKPQPSVTTPTDASWRDAKCDLWRNSEQYARDCCPYGKVGDLLWVREGFCEAANDDGTLVWNEDGNTYKVHYRCDDREHDVIHLDDDGGFKWNKDGTAASPWKSPLHMPRWASRITLEITGVRVERLQDISEEDVIDEGVTIPVEAISANPNIYWRVSGKSPAISFMPADKNKWTSELIYKAHFAELWSTIHAADGSDGWAANPWVWVLTFKRLESGAA